MEEKEEKEVQVEPSKVKPKQFLVLFHGENFESLAQVLVKKSEEEEKEEKEVQVKPRIFVGFGSVLVWSGSGENFESLAQV